MQKSLTSAALYAGRCSLATRSAATLEVVNRSLVIPFVPEGLRSWSNFCEFLAPLMGKSYESTGMDVSDKVASTT
jgi:hypothetical protein